MPKISTLPKSKYKGVYWASTSKKWRSILQHKGEVYQCGFYDDDLEAVKARDRTIIRLGLKAKLQIYKPLIKQQ